MYQQNLNSLSHRVLQYPGNEAEFRSDKNKHRWPNSGPLIWGVHPLVLVARLIFRAGKFRPRPETIFHLQWTKYICIASPQTRICMPGSFDKMQSQILEPEDGMRGTFVLLREGQSPDPPDLLGSSQSFISISHLPSFPILAKSYKEKRMVTI